MLLYFLKIYYFGRIWFVFLDDLILTLAPLPKVKSIKLEKHSIAFIPSILFYLFRIIYLEHKLKAL